MRYAGTEVLFHPSVDSTQSLAKRLAAEGNLAPGTVIVAAEQSGGYGRQGRHWSSPPGGLWFSLALPAPAGAGGSGIFAVFHALAIAAAIREDCGLATRIKWPNDILVDGKKLAGCLLESCAGSGNSRWLIAGAGINANNPVPGELEGKAVSLAQALSRPVDCDKLLASIIRHLDRSYPDFLADRTGAYLDEYRACSSILGRMIEVDVGGALLKGECAALDSSGNLVLRPGQGPDITLAAGEVTRVFFK